MSNLNTQCWVSLSFYPETEKRSWWLWWKPRKPFQLFQPSTNPTYGPDIIVTKSQHRFSIWFPTRIRCRTCAWWPPGKSSLSMKATRRRCDYHTQRVISPHATHANKLTLTCCHSAYSGRECTTPNCFLSFPQPDACPMPLANLKTNSKQGLQVPDSSSGTEIPWIGQFHKKCPTRLILLAR